MAGELARMELKTQRIEALCDGIFAIAMTILALSFETLFEPAHKAENGQLLRMLAQLWPDFLYYVMSFFILGVFWLQHHNQFHFIKHADIGLLFINIIGLMFITLIPFATVIEGDYHNTHVAAFFFELNLFIAGVVFFLHWVYASSGHRLVDKDLDERIIASYRKRNLIIPAMSLVAMPLTLINPKLGTAVYFLVPGVLFLYMLKTRKIFE